MNIFNRFLLAAACVLPLSGCFVSDYDLFPPTGGVEAPLTLGPLLCSSFKESGKLAKKVASQFIKLNGTDGPSYIVVGKDDTTALSFSFHPVRGDRYIIAMAFTSMVETIYTARVTDSVLEIFDDSMKTIQPMADANHVTVSSGQFDIKLEGTEVNQKAFMLAVAGDTSKRTLLYRCEAVK